MVVSLAFSFQSVNIVEGEQCEFVIVVVGEQMEIILPVESQKHLVVYRLGKAYVYWVRSVCISRCSFQLWELET